MDLRIFTKNSDFVTRNPKLIVMVMWDNKTFILSKFLPPSPDAPQISHWSTGGRHSVIRTEQNWIQFHLLKQNITFSHVNIQLSSKSKIFQSQSLLL